ncbi:MAG: flippase [Luteolibacter sp.]
MQLLRKFQAFIPQSRTRGLLTDSVWQFSEMGVRMGLNLVVGALIARHLSTAGFGMLNYVAAVITFVFPMVKLGLDTVILREIAVHPEKTGPVLKAATRVTSFSGILGAAGILAFAFSGGHDRELAWALAVGALACIGNPLGVYYGVLKANFYAGTIARFRIVLAVVFAIIRLGLVFAGAQAMAFVAAVVVEEIVSNVICYILCRRYSLLGSLGDSLEWKAKVKPLVSAGFPLMLSFLLIGIYSRVDVVMLEHLRGMTDTGIYAAGYKISELWNCIPGIFVGTFLPHFAKLRVGEPEAFLRIMRRFAAGFFWGGLCIVGFTVLAAPVLVRWLYGADFLDAIPALRLHVLCFPAVCMGGLLGHWYILEEKPFYLVFASIVGLIVNVGFNYLWIVPYGAAGASAATALSASINVVAPLICFPRTRLMAKTALQGIFLRLR